MRIEIYLTLLIPILIVSAQYPLFVSSILFNKSDILKKLSIANLFIGISSLAYYRYDSSMQLYLWLSIEMFMIDFMYILYIMIFKKSLSNIFDSTYIESKYDYIVLMENYAKAWKLVSKVFEILMYTYLPIYIIINYKDINVTLELIAQQILLILNYFIWKRCGELLLRESNKLNYN